MLKSKCDFELRDCYKADYQPRSKAFPYVVGVGALGKALGTNLADFLQKY